VLAVSVAAAGYLGQGPMLRMIEPSVQHLLQQILTTKIPPVV
jgi:hypothetical protein